MSGTTQPLAIFTAEQLGPLLYCSPQTIRKVARRGQLKHHLIPAGGRKPMMRITLQDARNFARKCGVPTDLLEAEVLRREQRARDRRAAA